MKKSTTQFISSMRRVYGPEHKIGRGNILNFGDKVIFAIGNSKKNPGNDYFFAIPYDLIEGKISEQTPLGNYSALILDTEKSVLILPQYVVSEWMQGVKTNRVHVVLRDGRYFFRASGCDEIDVTNYLNNYPKIGPSDEEDINDGENITPREDNSAEIREHTRIQWILIRFGLAAGYSVWVPPIDQKEQYNSVSFSELTISQLPSFGFDQNTRRIVSNIDVLWIEQNVIHNAFEIESTTSIYSGLLRMSDLVMAQPNINIDLNLVAPLSRRKTVRSHILRPTFSHLRPKCAYLSFEEVTNKYEMVKTLINRRTTIIRGLLESERF